MNCSLKTRLLVTTFATLMLSTAGALPAFASNDWPPYDSDPNDYFSRNDHDGYFDSNGQYHHIQQQESEHFRGHVSFESFHDQLSHHGYWEYSDRWGEVWQPGDVSENWRPYSDGHWVDTDEYGWLWVSNEPFGDITYHYGRWVNDPDDGWLWIPGYVWSPAWVVWRHAKNYVGWMPMPPDERFLHGSEFGNQSNISIGVSVGGVNVSFNNWNDTNDEYGYSRWYGHDYSRDRFDSMWTFVPTGHVADPDYRHYEAPRTNITTIIQNSTNTTNYTVINNYVVNKSVNTDEVRQAGAQIHPVKAAEVIKQPSLIVPVDQGHKIQMQTRAAMPHGTGTPNSAPKPTEAQVKTLSTQLPTKPPGVATNAPHPMHLLTRDAAATIARPNDSKPVPLTAADKAKAISVLKKTAPSAMPGNATPAPGMENKTPPGATAPTGNPAQPNAAAPGPKKGPELGKPLQGLAPTTPPGAPTPATGPEHMKAHPGETLPATATPPAGPEHKGPPGLEQKGLLEKAPGTTNQAPLPTGPELLRKTHPEKLPETPATANPATLEHLKKNETPATGPTPLVPEKPKMEHAPETTLPSHAEPVKPLENRLPPAPSRAEPRTLMPETPAPQAIEHRKLQEQVPGAAAPIREEHLKALENKAAPVEALPKAPVHEQAKPNTEAPPPTKEEKRNEKKKEHPPE